MRHPTAPFQPFHPPIASVDRSPHARQSTPCNRHRLRRLPITPTHRHSTAPQAWSTWTTSHRSRSSSRRSPSWGWRRQRRAGRELAPLQHRTVRSVMVPPPFALCPGTHTYPSIDPHPQIPPTSQSAAPGPIRPPRKPRWAGCRRALPPSTRTTSMHLCGMYFGPIDPRNPPPTNQQTNSSQPTPTLQGRAG